MENINLDNLATKDDVKQMGEKIEGKWNADLKLLSEVVATKEDLHKMASKEDLHEMENRLTTATKEDLHKMEDRLTVGNDEVVKELREMRAETAAHFLSYKQHDEKFNKQQKVLNEHENRIGALELKPTKQYNKIKF